MKSSGSPPSRARGAPSSSTTVHMATINSSIHQGSPHRHGTASSNNHRRTRLPSLSPSSPLTPLRRRAFLASCVHVRFNKQWVLCQGVITKADVSFTPLHQLPDTHLVVGTGISSTEYTPPTRMVPSSSKVCSETEVREISPLRELLLQAKRESHQNHQASYGGKTRRKKLPTGEMIDPLPSCSTSRFAPILELTSHARPITIPLQRIAELKLLRAQHYFDRFTLELMCEMPAASSSSHPQHQQPKSSLTGAANGGDVLAKSFTSDHGGSVISNHSNSGRGGGGSSGSGNTAAVGRLRHLVVAKSEERDHHSNHHSNHHHLLHHQMYSVSPTGSPGGPNWEVVTIKLQDEAQLHSWVNYIEELQDPVQPIESCLPRLFLSPDLKQLPDHRLATRVFGQDRPIPLTSLPTTMNRSGTANPKVKLPHLLLTTTSSNTSCTNTQYPPSTPSSTHPEAKQKVAEHQQQPQLAPSSMVHPLLPRAPDASDVVAAVVTRPLEVRNGVKEQHQLLLLKSGSSDTTSSSGSSSSSSTPTLYATPLQEGRTYQYYQQESTTGAILSSSIPSPLLTGQKQRHENRPSDYDSTPLGGAAASRSNFVLTTDSGLDRSLIGSDFAPRGSTCPCPCLSPGIFGDFASPTDSTSQAAASPLNLVLDQPSSVKSSSLKSTSKPTTTSPTRGANPAKEATESSFVASPHGLNFITLHSDNEGEGI